MLAVDIMWDNLTYLIVVDLAFNECMQVVRQAPLLQFCVLALGSSSMEIPSIPKPIVRLMPLSKHTITGRPQTKLQWMG
jgi:hypothetical protein